MPRGSSALSTTIAFGNFARTVPTIAATPRATFSGVALARLFVPIISTTTRAFVPSSSPFCARHSTNCVRSPEMPKSATLPSGAIARSHTSLPRVVKYSVIESPRNSTSMPPCRARAT